MKKQYLEANGYNQHSHHMHIGIVIAYRWYVLP